MKNERKDFVSRLASLGCAYHTTKGDKEYADPEQTILDSLHFYWTSNDLTFMLYGLIKHRVHSLIHVKRLISLAKDQHIKEDELVVLLVIAHKLVAEGHSQFRMVLEKLDPTKSIRMKSPPQEEASPSLIKIWGEDPHFKLYGAKVRTFYQEDKKKFLTLKGIYKRNPWFKFRALIGVNYRADIAFMKFSGKATTGYQAQQLVGCGIQPAYKVWHSLSSIEGLTLSLLT